MKDDSETMVHKEQNLMTEQKVETETAKRKESETNIMYTTVERIV